MYLEIPSGSSLFKPFFISMIIFIAFSRAGVIDLFSSADGARKEMVAGFPVLPAPYMVLWPWRFKARSGDMRLIALFKIKLSGSLRVIASLFRSILLALCLVYSLAPSGLSWGIIYKLKVFKYSDWDYWDFNFSILHKIIRSWRIIRR